MKYLTKENILLAMVGFLFLVQVNDMRKSGRGSERSRGAIMEGMKKSRKGKAESAAISLSPGVTCCDQKLPCCDQDLACCDHKS